MAELAFGVAQATPGRQEGAIGGEALDAVVMAIGDIHRSVGSDRGGLGGVEVADRIGRLDGVLPLVGQRPGGRHG